MNIAPLTSKFHTTSLRVRAIAATALVGLATAVTLAAPSAHAATVSSAAASTVSYGEVARFHCTTGVVTFDFLSIPAGTFSPTTYTPEVYIYYGGAWHF